MLSIFLPTSVVNQVSFLKFSINQQRRSCYRSLEQKKKSLQTNYSHILSQKKKKKKINPRHVPSKNEWHLLICAPSTRAKNKRFVEKFAKYNTIRTITNLEPPGKSWGCQGWKSFAIRTKNGNNPFLKGWPDNLRITCDTLGGIIQKFVECCFHENNFGKFP